MRREPVDAFVRSGSAHTALRIQSRLDVIAQSEQEAVMSHDLAYTMLLIHQHQAHNLTQQQKLQQLFLTFVAGQLTAEQYERSLALMVAK